MGTEVYCKSYHSMRDPNENSNLGSWTLYCGDKSLRNGEYFKGFIPRVVADAYRGYDKDSLRHKMLEHEAIFRDQVCELHRLYRIQRDMMEEIKRNDMHKHQISNGTSSSSSHLPHRVPSEDVWKWPIPSFQMPNAAFPRKPIPSAESPQSFKMGNGTRVDPSIPLNGCILKEGELLESRPSKVRKKLFDLHLPAVEYIDEEEGPQFQDTKIIEMPKFYNRNHKSAPESSVNWLGGGMIDSQQDASTSHSRWKNSIRLADLNEPILIEDTTESTSAEFIGQTRCYGEVRGLNLTAKLKTESVYFPKEVGQNSKGSNNGKVNDPSVDEKGNGRECFSYKYGAGHNKFDLMSVTHCPQQDNLPLSPGPTQHMLNKAHPSSGVLRSDHVEEVKRRERAGYSSHNQVEVLGSHIMGTHPSMHSSELANSWSQSPIPLGKSSTQKFTDLSGSPHFNSAVPLSRASQSSAPSHGIFGNKWAVSGSYDLGLSNQPDLNGFYCGAHSGSKELSTCLPSHGCNLLSRSPYENGAYDRYGSEKFSQSSNFIDLKHKKDMNLNSVFSKGSHGDTIAPQDIEIVARKNKLDEPVLPWLRSKPSCKNEASIARKDSKFDLNCFEASSDIPCNSDHEKDHGFAIGKHSVSSTRTVEAVTERKESQSTQRILGFPILDVDSASEKKSSVQVSTFSSIDILPSNDENIDRKEKVRVIDINVACDSSLPEFSNKTDLESPSTERAMDRENISARDHIDLNSCIEEEDSPAPPVESQITTVRIVLDIDLEAPVIPESEEDVPSVVELHGKHDDPLKSQTSIATQEDDEISRIAAEAIVAISSASHIQVEDKVEDALFHQFDRAKLIDPLLWFVEIASSYAEKPAKCDEELRGRDEGDARNSFFSEMDDFEAMTLRLEATKEEDYMPKPFVPEFQKVEETANTALSNRPRRGYARRGRQRRDFQRDILPGLASLSRHEVAEDLQAFAGIMKATGHPWNLGTTRRNGTRNGAGRGRRRSGIEASPPVVSSSACTPLVQQLNSIEVRLEDRSLTGWGKTTRRPRRQRCPSGNPPTPLT